VTEEDSTTEEQSGATPGSTRVDGSATDEAIAALDSFFESYSDAYTSLDLQAVLDHYTVPLLSVTEDDLFWLTTEGDLESVMGAYLESLRDREYGRGDIDALSYHVLSGQDVIASSAWTRYTTDGAVLERLGTTYFCRLLDGDWQIVALVVHDPEQLIS
jgi:ketosteroid isomerase-like protein